MSDSTPSLRALPGDDAPSDRGRRGPEDDPGRLDHRDAGPIAIR